MAEHTDLNLHDPIAAPATPWGQSALAVIRVSGTNCIEKMDALFRGLKGEEKLAGKRGYSLSRGYLYDPADGEAVDEVLAAVYRAPHSYTGEDAVELFCHGSPAAVKKTLALLYQTGFRRATPGEYTLRAFLNGKMDLTRAEAVNEIIHADTDKARRLALQRLSGGIEKIINGLKSRLVGFLSAVEVRLDYPGEEYEHDALSGTLSTEVLDGIISEMQALLDTYRAGRVYQEGATVVLAGRTNSGKSTLFNLLLREDRSIVSEVHGTTRDFIEGAISVAGIPVRLYDTAGLRAAEHPVEAEGVRRSGNLINNAELVVYLVDAAAGFTAEDEAFFAEHKADGRIIPVWNKCDIGHGKPPRGFAAVSALSGQGLRELEREIEERLIGGGPREFGAVVIDSLHQKQYLEQGLAALRRAREALGGGVSLDLLAVDLKDALDSLGYITGEVTSEEILRAVFERFCVGK
jgi:tRNA modification GTPase